VADVKPRGYAATAAEFLDEAAVDGDGRNLAVRQLAALQGIGYGLLAIVDQLADVADTGADCGGRLDEIADYIADLSGEPLGSRVLGTVRRLARRARPGAARDAKSAEPLSGTGGVISGRENALTRYADQWLRDNPGGLVGVYDLKDVPGDGLAAAYEARRGRMAGGSL